MCASVTKEVTRLIPLVDDPILEGIKPDDITSKNPITVTPIRPISEPIPLSKDKNYLIPHDTMVDDDAMEPPIAKVHAASDPISQSVYEDDRIPGDFESGDIAPPPPITQTQTQLVSRSKYKFVIKTTSGTLILPPELPDIDGLPQYGPPPSPLEMLEYVVPQVTVPFVLSIETDDEVDAVAALTPAEWQGLWEILRNSYFYIGINFYTRCNLKDYFDQEVKKLEEVKYWEKKKLDDESEARKVRLQVIRNIMSVCQRNIGLVAQNKQVVQSVITDIRQKVATMKKVATGKCLVPSLISSALLTGSLAALFLFLFPPLLPLAFVIGGISIPINYWLEKRQYNKEIAKLEKYTQQLERGEIITEEKPPTFLQKVGRKIGGFIVDFAPAFSLLIGIIGLAAAPLAFLPFWAFILLGVVGAATAGGFQISIDEDIKNLQGYVETLDDMCKMRSDIQLQALSIGPEERKFIYDIRAKQLGISVKQYEELLEGTKKDPKKLKEMFQKANDITLKEKAAYMTTGLALGATCGAAIYAFLIPSLVVGILSISLATPVGWALVAAALVLSCAVAIFITAKYYKNGVKQARAKTKIANQSVNQMLNIFEKGGRCDMENIKTTKPNTTAPTTTLKKFSAKLSNVLTHPVTTGVFLGALALTTAILIPVFWPAAIIAGICSIVFFAATLYTRHKMKERVTFAKEVETKIMTKVKEQNVHRYGKGILDTAPTIEKKQKAQEKLSDAATKSVTKETEKLRMEPDGNKSTPTPPHRTQTPPPPYDDLASPPPYLDDIAPPPYSQTLPHR